MYKKKKKEEKKTTEVNTFLLLKIALGPPK
jgi:hypothetical protein